MTGGGSVVVRRQLGLKLRALRLAANKDVIDVTEAGLASKAKMSRIETGKGPVKIADVRALCWLYGADSATTDALAAMAPGTQEEGWLEEYGSDAIPDWFGLYAGLEATASRIRRFEPALVDGLVQTPDYAAAVMRADPRVSEDIIDRRIRFRMERQRVVLRPDSPPAVTLVIAEGALSLVIGSPAVMAAQIDYLRSSEIPPNVSIRILPFVAGVYLPHGAFALLDFEDDEDPSVAYTHLRHVGARYFDRSADRADYEYAFDLVMKKSLPIETWRKK